MWVNIPVPWILSVPFTFNRRVCKRVSLPWNSSAGRWQPQGKNSQWSTVPANAPFVLSLFYWKKNWLLTKTPKKIKSRGPYSGFQSCPEHLFLIEQRLSKHKSESSISLENKPGVKWRRGRNSPPQHLQLHAFGLVFSTELVEDAWCN